MKQKKKKKRKRKEEGRHKIGAKQKCQRTPKRFMAYTAWKTAFSYKRWK